MSHLILDRRTPEEKAEQERKDYERLFLEEGKPYTWDLSNTWSDGYGFIDEIHAWDVYIRQAFCPWSLCALESFEYHRWIPGASFIAKAKAEKWGRDYLERGGPPADYWKLQPPPKDPNMKVFRPSNK